MKKTIASKINIQIIEKIDEHCQSNEIFRSDWLKEAIKDKIVKDNILSSQQEVKEEIW